MVIPVEAPEKMNPTVHLDPPETRVRPVKPTFPVDSQLSYLLAPVIQSFDKEFLNPLASRSRKVGDPRGPCEFGPDETLVVLYSADEVAQRLGIYAGGLHSILQQHDDVDIFFPLQGARPIMEAVERHVDGDFHNRLSASAMHSTQGTTTGGATMFEGDIPQSVIDRTRTLVIGDDVLDSGLSWLRVAQLRLSGTAFKDRIATVIQNLHNLQHMQDANGRSIPFDDERYKDVYLEAARCLAAAKVVFAPLFCKNNPLLDAVYKHASMVQKHPDPWAKVQSRVANWAVRVDAGAWLLGGMDGAKSPMLDWGLRGEDIWELLPDELKAYLEPRGFRNLYFRIGPGIQSLVALNPDKEVQQRVIDQCIRHLMRNFTQIPE